MIGTALEGRGKGDGKILDVEPEPEAFAEGRPGKQAGCWPDEVEGNQHQIVKREDAQQSPHEEVAKVVRGFSRIEQDTGNKIAGQDEEEVHAGLAPLCQPHDKPVALAVKKLCEVDADHQQNGDSADAI